MPLTETEGFTFNHTMVRVKDPKVSLKFYTETIGMDIIDELHLDDCTIYFLGYDVGDGKLSREDRAKARFDREGVLELMHINGTESDPNFKGYVNGNEEPTLGFGHIAITVPDIDKACARFEALGVPFKKKPSDGKVRHIAFIVDPDGYWIEIVAKNRRA